MALQTTGQIKLSEIATEFGDTAPHALSEFYGKGNAPASGEIELATDFYGASASFYSYTVDKSAIFHRNDDSRLDKTFGSGDRSNWTFSTWLKRGRESGSQEAIFSARNSSTQQTHLWWNSDGRLRYETKPSGDIYTNAKLVDYGNWYHVVVKKTSSSVTIYVNGVAMTVTGTTPSSGEHYVNDNIAHRIGGQAGGSEYGHFYMAETHFVSGSGLNPTSFGELVSGVWRPKEYTGSYGTTGFYLKFNGNANDSSGNGNNWSPSGLNSQDYLIDSPTNNFCVLNPLSAASPVDMVRGGLFYSTNGGAASYYSGTIGMESGKWYYEYRLRSGTVDIQGGITDIRTNYLGSNDFASWRYKTNGNLEFQSGYTGSWATSYTTNDIIGVAVDVDAGTLRFYKNGSLVGTKTGLTSSGSGKWIPYFIGYNNPDVNVNFGQDSTFDGATTAGNNADANGYGNFKYAPPSGHLALCAANLPVAESVDAQSDNSPSDHFNVVLYTGSDGTPASVSGVGFQPDFVWVKSRANSGNHTLADAVRGIYKSVYTNVTNTEVNNSTGLLSFNSDGFSYGTSGDWSDSTHVAWNWKANGSGSTNTSGSITSTVSANTGAGFSIVSYTGVTGTQTVGHGLSQAPQMIIIKNRDSSENWRIYHQGAGPTKAGKFTIDAWNEVSAYWNNTAPTSSVFTVTSAAPEVNENGKRHIAYCFHEVAGFSSFTFYRGNNQTGQNAPFVYLGFRARYVMFKNISNGNSGWVVVDTERNPYNDTSTSDGGMDQPLFAARNITEQNNTGIFDLTSTGFKFKQTGDTLQKSGQIFMVMAFAENPLKYARAF